MTRLSGLLLVCAGLAGIIALEISNAPSGDVAPPQTRAATAIAHTPQPATNRTLDWVTAVLARPLFSPDRRPAADAASVAGSSLPGLPRLAGILVGPFGRSAIFAADGSKPIVVQEGGRVGAYTVRSIEVAQVQIVGPDGVQVLNPSFDQALRKSTTGALAPARRSGQAPLPR
jgi:hypothetical protein